MFKPATFATVEDRIVAEVEMVEHELVRVDSRLRALGWSASASARRVAETWAEIALGVVDDHQADGDGVARTVLQAKRDALLFRLGELRQQLTGRTGGQRRGWG